MSRWGKKKVAADLQQFNGKTSIIAAGALLVGDLRVKGAVQLDGRLQGNLIAEDGLVRVSTGGLVEGEIHAKHVILDGEVTGDVHASEQVELGADARVRGNLYYGLMEMTIGAQVEGRLFATRDGAAPLELPAPLDAELVEE
ncbi:MULTISPECIES: polymer-forming cytoskeletal protein [Pseudomonas]|jgi:cytoskeletal protein CcmA (bactofilin family)|uniref:Polymer-forming cytoskeletal protein n=1 Tax=Serpens gallinarum TaxID=2763075 RepID=A0ABR8TK44_9PSED|nr:MULTISPECIES: polymer-forming cytoskeletal protein [Pseudomonas]MBD7975883.1 polymer-forming cytoskeletal protein [Serpens gallinarum]MBF0675220.1 polymer-forming cytoskeletal protein [Pseudomonas sp.]